MSVNAPLLLFRIYSISKDAYWSGLEARPLPQGCAAIVASGGMPDIAERRRGKSSPPNENGVSGILTPFLHSAPNWVMCRVIWALTGPGGRFHPIYRASRFALQLRGFDPSALPETKHDVVASVKLHSLQQALEPDWHSDFLTCFSNGLGLGFWGDVSKLERKLERAKSFAVLQKTDDYQCESVSERMSDTHPYLYANWQEHGFERLLEMADLVVRPWGWEGEDAILLSTRMSHDQMLEAISHDLRDELQVTVYDGDDQYLRWVSWPLGGEGDQWTFD